VSDEQLVLGSEQGDDVHRGVVLGQQCVSSCSEEGDEEVRERTFCRLFGLRLDQVDVLDRYQRVDVLVLVERHRSFGTAMLVNTAVREVVVVSLHLAEDALDVAG